MFIYKFPRGNQKITYKYPLCPIFREIRLLSSGYPTAMCVFLVRNGAKLPGKGFSAAIRRTAREARKGRQPGTHTLFVTKL